MERLPVELIYVLVFLGIVLFNLMRQLAARRRQQEEQAQPQPAAPAPAEEQPLENIWGRAALPAAPAPVSPPRPSVPPPSAPPVPRRIHPVRALLRDRRDLRRAVVLAMVLGPCRAQQPPGR